MELPSGQSLYSYCSNISMTDVHNLVLMRGVTGIICFLLCLLSFILEIIYLCSKRGSTVLQRFFLYVIVSNLLRAAFLSMDVFSHKDSLNVNKGFCEAIGFLSQYFASFQLLTIIAMMLLMFRNLLTFNQKYMKFCSKLSAKLCSLKHNKLCLKLSAKSDFSVILILFLIPSLYTWIPFTIGGGRYGDAGPWCWLKAFDSNCTSITADFILETAFWNVPFGVVLIFCLVCVTTYLIFFLYLSLCRVVSYQRMKPVMVDTFILFLFLALYTTLCVIEVSALMVVHFKEARSSYSWLVLYAVTLPIGEISLSLSSFVHFFRFMCKPSMKAQVLNNSISKFSHKGKIPPSTKVSVNSYTSQRDRPYLLSPSTAEQTSIDSFHYGTLVS